MQLHDDINTKGRVQEMLKKSLHFLMKISKRSSNSKLPIGLVRQQKVYPSAKSTACGRWRGCRHGSQKCVNFQSTTVHSGCSHTDLVHDFNKILYFVHTAKQSEIDYNQYILTISADRGSPLYWLQLIFSKSLLFSIFQM